MRYFNFGIQPYVLGKRFVFIRSTIYISRVFLNNKKQKIYFQYTRITFNIYVSQAGASISQKAVTEQPRFIYFVYYRCWDCVDKLMKDYILEEYEN